ncbi:MAG TPA: translocation/assembly module TamB domain-containing protein, partial [Candidatus Polarisedimenticolaceae bacterium]|nr:translocation/assembly module TamB domain-containing protein [Candidatus Polarisedimenticolaceae bacterium]
HTDGFREFVREKLETSINDTITGSISVGRIDGSVWGNVILHDVVVRHQGAEILEIPELKISYSLFSLLWGRLHIFQLAGSRPTLRLRRDEDNQLNIVQAFSPKQPQNEEPSGLVIFLNSVSLREGHVELRLAGPKPQNYTLENVTLDGRIHARPGMVTIDLSRVASRLNSPGLPELSIDGAVAYRETDGTDTLEMANLLVATGDSRAKMNGKITDLRATNLDVKIAVERLTPLDIRRLFADWPIRHDVVGTIAVNGPLSALSFDIDLAAAGAKLTANLELETAGETPHYRGNMNLRDFDLTRLLGRNDIGGIVSATLEGGGTGFSLGGLAARGVIRMQNAAVAGWALGEFSMDGRVHESLAEINGNLKSKMGFASWQGEVSLKEKPAYQLSLGVENLDLQKAAGDEKQIAGKISLKGIVTGTGLTPRDMIVRTELKILPSTIGPVEVQQGSVIANLAQQRVQILEATARTQDAMLTVKGDIGLDPKQNGKLDYVVRSANLTPWLALANQQGSGSIELTGRASGNIADLQSQGRMKLAGLRLRDTSIKSGNIDFDLRLAGTQSLPQGTMKVRFAEIQAGIPLQRLDGSIGLGSKKHYEIGIDLKAVDQAKREHILVGQVDYQPQLIIARLDRVGLSLDDGLWQLSRSATITLRGDNFDIDGLVLRNRLQQIAINGQFATSGKQDLAVIVEGLPISAVSAFLPKPLPMTGTLTVRAQVTGTAAAPEVTASANLTDSSIGGQSYGGIVGDIAYRSRTADIKLTVRQDPDHMLTANGTIPLILRWSPQWQAEATGDMNLRVQSNGLSIAFLNAFSGDAAQSIAGIIALDVTAQGPMTKPILRGTFQLQDGGVAFKPLGVQVAAITADGRFDGKTVSLRQISARAKDGRLNGSGILSLKNYSPEDFKISLALSRWPAIETQRYRATVAGNIEAQGPLGKPSLKGQIEVLNAEVRPDLAFLSRGRRPLTRDETILIVRGRAREEAQAQESKTARPADNELFKNARVDLSVVVPNQAWIRHPEANVELSGKLRAVKEAGKQITLSGTISVVRGWIGFQGRRFNLIRGSVEFRGDETLNPALDIVAQHRLQQYQVEVIVTGTLEKPVLTLRSDPALEQADILALLIFGKPLNTLNRNEQNTLQQSAAEMAGGFAASKVAEAVSEALGLDRLGLDLGEIGVNAGQIGFRRYIGSRTYVSISQDLSGETGREVTIEYQIG